MWALVEDNTITKIINKPISIVIGDTRHSRKIFQLWPEEDLNSIGIYSVIFNNSNKRNAEYYINTNQSFNYVDGEVTASYGTATPKELADSLWTQEDSDNGDLPDNKEIGDVKVKGLKSRKKEIIKKQASELLEKTDWYNHKALDDETFTIPANIKTYRADVRTRSNEMETAIDNASDVDALASLYEYTEQADGSHARPLGEWPTLED